MESLHHLQTEPTDPRQILVKEAEAPAMEQLLPYL